ncbi:MAG: STAS domain-containing protein [Deltaproteobacteria bacterium]|nr:STAS domain-containing protein [Deltaproteobacteria bacterium]
MQIRPDDTGLRGVWILTEGLTVSQVSEARTALMDALERFEEVFLDVDGTPEIDLCGLQLLCAARRTASNRSRRIVLSGRAFDSFGIAAARAGSCFHRECGPGDEGCPWQERTR